MFRNVEFLSEGATIRGRLYLRSEGRPRGSLSNEDGAGQPVVIMTHGTSATITMGAERCAEVRNKAGFAQSSVAKYMVKRRGPPSQGWRTFLRNHAPDIAAMDLFVVPTICFDLLYAFVIIRLDRRDLVWINVTANPTAEWVAR